MAVCGWDVPLSQTHGTLPVRVHPPAPGVGHLHASALGAREATCSAGRASLSLSSPMPTGHMCSLGQQQAFLK